MFMHNQIRRAKRMRRIELTCVACLVLQWFFLHCRINGTIVAEKSLCNVKWAFWFSLHSFSETFLILTIIRRDVAVNAHRANVFLWTSHYSCQILMKLKFYRKFAKSSGIRFNENPSSVSHIVSCGQTDRQTVMTNLQVAFRNFTKEHENFKLC